MSILDEVAIPQFIGGLKTLDHILTKAEDYAKSKGLEATIFPGARLIEDQNPLTFQVQNATKTVKTTLIRYGVNTQPFEDKESTFEDLHARIKKALDELKSVEKGAYTKNEHNIVDLPFGGKVLKITARDATLKQGIPNFFFHLNTAFSILRSKGVPIGKADYIGSFVA